jgi:hypothetical protein
VSSTASVGSDFRSLAARCAPPRLIALGGAFVGAVKRPHRLGSMISIPRTEQAYEAVKARIPRIDQAPTSKGRNGKMRIWVDRKFVDRLLELRSAGENYSDVLLAPDDGSKLLPLCPASTRRPVCQRALARESANPASARRGRCSKVRRPRRRDRETRSSRERPKFRH